MKIGGYQIIDLKGKNLTTDVGMVYEGIYELIEGTRKPILLSGIQVDDTEYQDVFTSVSINGSAFELKAYNKIFTIEDTDVVTVSDDNSSGNGGNVDGGVVRFTLDNIGENSYTYECEVPANKTWRECIINNLIKTISTTNDSEMILVLGFGSDLSKVLPITLSVENNRGDLVRGALEIPDIVGTNFTILNVLLDQVRENDIIEAGSYNCG